MRVLVHDFSGHPFQVRLSRALAETGDDVLHAHCPDIVTPKGDLRRRPTDSPNFSLCALRAGSVSEFPKYDIPRRVVREIRYARDLVHTIDEFAPDVVLLSNDPPVARTLVVRSCRKRRVPVIVWLQDLYALGLRLLYRRRYGLLAWVPGSIARALERDALRRATAIVVISDDFVSDASRSAGAGMPVFVIENWAPVDELPLSPRMGSLRAELGVGDRFLFLYAGTLGLKHDPELLLALARTLRDDECLLVCSEGPGASALRERGDAEGLGSLLVSRFQDYDRLAELLGTADVLCAILSRDAARHAVPSKVMTYHTAGRAILVAIPADNAAARFVERVGSGIVVDPADTEGWIAAARQLRTDSTMRVRCASNARRAAEREFDIERIAARFRDVLELARSGGSPSSC